MTTEPIHIASTTPSSIDFEATVGRDMCVLRVGDTVCVVGVSRWMSMDKARVVGAALTAAAEVPDR